MSSPIRRWKFVWDYFIRGRHRLPPVPTPPDFAYPPPDETLMTFLVEMFSAHGAVSFRSGSWIVIDAGRLFARAACFKVQEQGQNIVLQVDFVCVSADGQHVIESFAGIGSDLSSALKDACISYQDSSFHVLFVTFLGRTCEHVEQEQWKIAGLTRTLTFGLLRTRGSMPLALWPPVFEALKKQIEAHSLPSGLHWVRYFYASIPGDVPTIEVLVNNETCDTLASQASDLPWPDSDEFYSARLFFTVQDVLEDEKPREADADNRWHQQHEEHHPDK